MTVSLTHNQKQCLDFIDGYIKANNGVGPSFEEIAAHMGTVKSQVYRFIRDLEDRGRIFRPASRIMKRAYFVIDHDSIPMMSLMAAWQMASHAERAALIRMVA